MNLKNIVIDLIINVILFTLDFINNSPIQNYIHRIRNKLYKIVNKINVLLTNTAVIYRS